MKYKTSQEMYNELINNDNKELVIQWKRALEEKRKLNFISLIICICVDILIVYIMSKIIGIQFSINNLFKLYFVAPILIVDAIIFISIPALGKELKEYSAIFKQKIIKGIMDNFYDSLEYFPNKQMPERIYNEPNYENYDNYYSDDYLEAKLDNKYNIAMAEVETEEEEEYTDSDGNKQTKTITLFHGMFAKVEMEKAINCDLDIKLNSDFNFQIFKTNKLEMDSRRI